MHDLFYLRMLCSLCVSVCARVHVCMCLGLGVNTPGFLSCSHPAITMTTSWLKLSLTQQIFLSLPLLHVEPPHPIPPYPLSHSVVYLHFIVSTIICCLLYLHPLLFALSLSLPFSSSPVASTYYILERVPSSCHLCRKSIFYLHPSLFHSCSLFSVPHWLPLTPYISMKPPFLSLNSFTPPFPPCLLSSWIVEAYGTLPSIRPALHHHYNQPAKIIHSTITGSILSTPTSTFIKSERGCPV